MHNSLTYYLAIGILSKWMTHFDLSTVIRYSRVSNGQMEMNSMGHKSLAERAANDKKSSASAFPLESKKKFQGPLLSTFFFFFQRSKEKESYHQNLWPIVSKLARISGSIHTNGRRIPRTIFFLDRRCWRSSWCWQARSLDLPHYRAKSALLHSHWKVNDKKN